MSADIPPMLSLLPLAVVSLTGQAPLEVTFVSGIENAIPGALGLGGGGLLPAAQWADEVRAARGACTTRGGVEVSVEGPVVRVAPARGPELTLDGQARFLGERGPLTQPALVGLALRFHDGAELRVWSGSRRGAREVSVTDHAREHVLARSGRTIAVTRPVRPFHGLRFYLCGDGDEVAALANFGPVLHVRPVLAHGGRARQRLVVLGDAIRDAVVTLQRETPRRSVQYPLAAKQAAFLAQVTRELFPQDELRTTRHTARAGIGAVFGFGPEVRWVLRPRGERPDLVLSLHLAPGAGASIELVMAPGRTTVHRVLARGRRARSRYLGAGPRVDDEIAARLPFERPLASPAQRQKAIAALRRWIVPAATTAR